MRLIDADYLKNLPFERVIHTDFGDTAIPIEEIDNAPTVEYTFEEAFQKTVCEQRLYCPQRPQGEWIPIKSLMEDNYHSRISFRCNQCRYVEGYRAKYCAGCGADMRPKPNQLRDCENCIHHSDNGCGVWECEFKRRSS